MVLIAVIVRFKSRTPALQFDLSFLAILKRNLLPVLHRPQDMPSLPEQTQVDATLGFEPWMEFVSSVIDSLSWPISIFIIVLILRRPLARLLERTASIRWGDKQIAFSSSLLAASKQVERAYMDSPDVGTDSSSSELAFSSVKQALRTSSKQPRQAIIEAWLEVEAALNAAGERLGLYESYGKRRDAGLAIRLLRSREHLKEDWVEALYRLRRLRNQAAHDRRFHLAPDQAEEYIQLCVDAITYIQKLGMRDV